MTISTHFSSLISRNHAIEGYQAPPTIQQLGQLWAANPSIPRTCIIACADPRCHPESIFGLDPSNPADAAVVIRVQGGDWLTAMPAILAIDHLLNFTHVVMLKHTDCGSGVFRDADIKTQLKERCGKKEGAKEIDSMRFGENTVSMEDAVRRDVKLMREEVLLREEVRANVVGMLFDIESGKVNVVE